MTTPYKTQLIRFKCDLEKHNQANDVLTSAAPTAWRSVDLHIDVAAFLGSAIADVSAWSTLLLRILPLNDFSATALITKSYNGPFNNITADDWAAGNAKHAFFDVPNAEMAFLTSIPAGTLTQTFSLVITGQTEDSKRFVLCRTTLQIDDCGAGSF